jgi:uncharacterized protein
MKYGLTAEDIGTLTRIFEKYPEILEVWLFGSRASDNFHAGSDVDLAVMNSGVSGKVIRQLHAEIEDSNLPYFVDLINFPELKNPGLKEQITPVGRLFYSNRPLPLVNERKAGYTEDVE